MVQKYQSMRKLFLSLAGAAILFSSYAQQYTNYWPFGHKAALDFSSGNAESTTSAFSLISEASTSISDAEGNLLFSSRENSIEAIRGLPVFNVLTNKVENF